LIVVRGSVCTSPTWPARFIPQKVFVMIKAAIVFLVIAAILAVLGFGGLVGLAIGIAEILFWVATAIAIILFIPSFTIFRVVT